MPEIDFTLQEALDILDSDDIEKRLIAIETLGQLKALTAVPKLLHVLTEPHYNTRIAIIKSLASIGEQAVPALKAFSGEADVEWAVSVTLWLIGGSGSSGGFMEDMFSNDGWQEVIAQTLGETGDPATISGLVEALLSSPKVDVRISAANALRELGNPITVPSLLTALHQDDVVKVRKHAAWALRDIAAPASLQGLLEALQDPDPEVRDFVAQALGELNNLVISPELVNALNDDDKNVRISIAHALGSTKDAAVVPQLADKLLNDPNELVRGAALSGLQQIAHPSIVPALAQALQQEAGKHARFLRARIIRALIAIGDSRCISVIVSVLQDENAEIRKTAIRSLGTLGQSAPVEALIPMLHDSDEKVQEQAVKTLEELGTPEALKAVESWRNDR